MRKTSDNSKLKPSAIRNCFWLHKVSIWTITLQLKSKLGIWICTVKMEMYGCWYVYDEPSGISIVYNAVISMQTICSFKSHLLIVF